MASSAFQRLQSYLHEPESFIDVIGQALHSAFIEAGFTSIGTDPSSPSPTSTDLPSNFNINNMLVSFVFKIDDIPVPIHIRVIPSGDLIDLHASLVLTDRDKESYPHLHEIQTFSNTLRMSDIVDEQHSPLQNKTMKKVNISDLIEYATFIHRQYGDLIQTAGSRTSTTSATTSQGGVTQQPATQQSGIRFPAERIDHGYPSVGRHDLEPSTVGGFPGLQPPSSGDRVGRDHPFFSGVHPPSHYGSGLPPGAVPPGARFDPFGPPAPVAPFRGSSSGGKPPSPHGPFRSEPDKDHLRPPGYGNFQFM
ncbi:hypothetical protein P9112_012769 [Eukaryota sp. TZLM1-RC]